MSDRRSLGGKLDNTRTHLKLAAQSLFARRGIDGVTVQQIVAAAGQRNNAALHYHFGTKEELIRELLVEGAQKIDRRRQEMLEQMGEPSTVRQVLAALVLPVVELDRDTRWRGYIRLVANVQMTNREILRSALADRWNAGYVTCLLHLRRLITYVPPPLLEQRLSFLGIYSNAVLAARDASLELSSTPHRLWSQASALENFIDTCEAVLTCTPSAAALQDGEIAGRT